MKFKFLTIALLTFITLNCSDSITNSTAGNFNLGDTITINNKEKLFNSENNLTIQFDSLVADSRCPIDVICVWEGDAELKFKFSSNDQSEIFSLHTFAGFNIDTVVFGYNIKLIDVFPKPITTQQYSSDDYSVKILIKEANE